LTVISSLVRVPVLSEHITVTEPRASTLARRDAAEPLLRPLTVSVAADAAAELVLAVAAALPRWRFVSDDVDNGTRRLRFVRTSRFFRFRDDVTVWIEDLGEQRIVRARSASRVGNADLGQNPRNLRALMQALTDRVR
jgi:uncharacterized protein (DUF1499 family)